MRQFGRRLRLNLGSASESVEITNLRVTFDVQKSLTEEPNPALIRVYNLNQSHRNLLVTKVYNRASLFVGYEDLRLIYQGDISEVTTHRDGLDFILELKCGDGQTGYTQGFVNKTLSSGATDAAILAEASRAMRTESGVIDLPNERKLPRGKVLTGNARGVMKKIAKNHNADWSIQDGQLTLLPKDKVLSDHEGFILSQETGMINSPEKTDDGLQIFCLCNPALRIGGLVRVKSIITEYNGDYKITELSHTGDLLGGDWKTQLTCVGGQYQKVEKVAKERN